MAAVYEREHELSECRHRISDLEQQLVKLQRLNVGLKNISYDLLQLPEREYQSKWCLKKEGLEMSTFLTRYLKLACFSKRKTFEISPRDDFTLCFLQMGILNSE
jgi:hypothetical protein